MARLAEELTPDPAHVASAQVVRTGLADELSIRHTSGLREHHDINSGTVRIAPEADDAPQKVKLAPSGRHCDLGFPSWPQGQLADAGPGFQCCERLRPICKFVDGRLARGENAGCDERE